MWFGTLGKEDFGEIKHVIMEANRNENLFITGKVQSPE